MRKYTQKQLRELVRLGMAQDITNYSFEQANALYTLIGNDRLDLTIRNRKSDRGFIRVIRVEHIHHRSGVSEVNVGSQTNTGKDTNCRG